MLVRQLAAALLLAGCANYAKESIALYDVGDYAGAARAADGALVTHPQDSALWGMRVRAALALGDAADLAKVYAAYVKQAGGDDKALLRDLATATIKQGLASPSVRLQLAAIDAVVDGDLALADEVVDKMQSQDDRVVAKAAAAILPYSRQGVEGIDAMLKSEDAEARRIAIDGLGKGVGAIANAELEKAARDPDPHVRAAALHWLGQLKDLDSVEVCTEMLHDKDENVRAAAATALAHIPAPNLADAAKAALADPALAVRIAGIDLARAAKLDDALVAVAQKDPDANVALAAALAVHDKAGPALRAAVDRALASPDWATRAGAANQLVAAVGKAEAVAIARKLLADKEPAVRLAAARTLARAGETKAAHEALIALVPLPDQPVSVAIALAELGDPTTLDTLVTDAKRPADVRAAAAAGHREAHRVTPTLVAALADPSALVRVEAASALGALAR